MSGNVNQESNLAKALRAWKGDCPEWVRILARACDATSQRAVGDKIGQSGGTISRVLSHSYAGDYAELERKVRAALTADRVACPVTGAMIQLKTCLRNRRRWRQGPPRGWLEHAYEHACPNCRHNTDQED